MVGRVAGALENYRSLTDRVKRYRLKTILKRVWSICVGPIALRGLVLRAVSIVKADLAACD